ALGRLPVDLRRPIVHELHAAGMSTRAIAPVVGVSNKTVSVDLNAPVTEVTPAVDRDTGEILDDIPADGIDPRRREPEPPRVTVGVDGKTYQRPTPISPERQREAELDRGRRDTCRAVSDAVRSLTGGEAQARIFLEHFYPHESRFLVDGERLTADRIQSAIEFLTTIQKETP